MRAILALCGLLVLVCPPRVRAQAPAQGWLHLVWGEDTTPGHDLHFYFVDDQGRGHEVVLDAAQRALIGPAARRGVRVTGSLIRSGKTLRLQDLRVLRPAPNLTASLAGIPYVTILCRFADITTSPFTATQVAYTLGTSYPGAGDYFGEVSGGAASLAGSRVVGWYDLPKSRSAYVFGTSADFVGLINDCTQQADADVDFTQFYGINLQFNAGLDTRAVPPYDTLSHGGTWTLSRDGVTRTYGVTFLSRGDAFNYVVLHHEMGHGLGWPHSSGPYGQTYDSRWDLMSVGYIYYDATFGWLGDHTVGYHKDLVGWVPAARRWTSGSGAPASFLLQRSALPPAGPAYVLAVIPLQLSPGQFYTAELRMTAGYDRGLPGEGVVLHRVNPGLLDRNAQVVDPDNNGDPNDAGALWLPGERFTDPAEGIVLRVDSATAQGMWLTIGTDVFALSPTGTRDTALLGATTPVADSAVLTLSGPDAATAGWTVTHRAAAAWLTLLDPAGQGSAVIHWQRNPTGLAAGRYLDTIAVAVGGAVGSPSFVADTFDVLGPLALSLGSSLRDDSLTLGSTGVLADSTGVDLTGVGAAGAVWTAVHGGAGWLSLTTGSGTGPGVVRWQRDPAGLAPGTYTDTVTVTAQGASGSPARVVDRFTVFELPVPPSCAVNDLLGVACLTATERTFLDQTGNRDGSYDLGDLLAFLDRKAISLSGLTLDRLIRRKERAR